MPHSEKDWNNMKVANKKCQNMFVIGSQSESFLKGSPKKQKILLF